MNARYLGRRVLGALGMLAFVLIFNFFLFRIVDSDPLAKYRGRVLTAEKRAEIIEKFGLEGSAEQFVRYVRQTLRLDFGYSTDTGRRVWSVIVELLPNTLWLVGLSTVITVALGLWLGAKAGWRRGGTFDRSAPAARWSSTPCPSSGSACCLVFRRPDRVVPDGRSAT